MEKFHSIMSKFGATSEEICEAIVHLPKIPFTEMNISLIRSNPGLSWFQKRKLIKKIKKEMTID